MVSPEQNQVRDCGNMFSPNRRFWSFATVLFGAISILKGIRMPTRWAATQALVNYDYGFVKRGLMGATLGRLFHGERYVCFSIVAYCLFALFICALVLFTVRSHAFERLGKGQIAALFFSSYGVTYLANLVGYLDILLAIFTIMLLLVEDPKCRFLIALPVCVVSLLLHESFLILFFPVILLSFLVDLLETSENKTRILWMCGTLTVFAVGLTLKLALRALMTPQQAAGIQAELARRANFPLRGDYFLVLSRSITDNLLIMKNIITHDLGWACISLAALIAFLPVVVLLVRSGFSVLHTYPRSQMRNLVTGFALLATTSPLLMNLFGWDCARWDAEVCLNAFLVVLILTRSAPRLKKIEFSARYQYVVILAIALSMATGEGLMYQKHISTFPFTSSFSHFVRYVRTSGWQPPAL